MKILVVEDEPGPREGICRLLRATSPDWEVLEPCSNGPDGVRVASEKHPDLVITDIRMPEGDGLEMIARLRAMDGNAVIVVLSGFSDFEYARRCLSLGVREYLVKPVTATVLISLVRSIEAGHSCDTDLFNWLEGRSELDEPGVLFLFRTHALPNEARRTALRRELTGLVGNPRGSLLVEFPASREVFFWIRGLGEISKQAAPRVLPTIAQSFHAPVIGGAIPVEKSGGPDAVQSLRARLKRFLLDPAPGFLWGTDAGPTVPFAYSLALEREGVQALQSVDSKALDRILERFLNEAFRDGFDPASSVLAAQRFLLALQNRLKDLDATRFEAFQAANPALLLEGALNREELRGVFRTLALILENRATGSAPGVGNLKIQSALTLIAKRLSSPPTLAACAEELGVSGEYLSRLFKAEMGIGYSRYVMNKRIESAKSVLAESDQTIQRVSVSLGFGNSKYFCAVFRKETGLTPSEYRSRSH